MDGVASAGKSTSYKQTFRRHRVLLSVPIILAVLVAGYFASHTGAKYESFTSLWVDTAPPAQSSVGAGAQALPTPPADGEQALLSELLTTRQFAVDVVKGSQLSRYFSSDAEIDKRAGLIVSPSTVTAVVRGPQILQISFTAPAPAVTQSALGAIVKELQKDSTGLIDEHNRAAIVYDQGQVQQDSAALNTSRKQVAAYLRVHPHSTANNDPNLAPIVSAENGASTQLAQASSALSQARGSDNGAGWLVEVVDPASTAISKALGKKKMVEMIFAGLLAGMLISFLGAVALTPARRRDPWEDELGLGTAGRSGRRLRGSSDTTAVDLADDDDPRLAEECEFIFDGSVED